MKLKEFYKDYMAYFISPDSFKTILIKVISQIYADFYEDYTYLSFLFGGLSNRDLKLVEYKFFTMLFKDRVVSDDVIEEKEGYPKYFLVDAAISSLLIQNMDKYEHLYQITKVKYDPIANYDRKEHTQTTYSDEHTTYVKGTDTVTDVYGHTTDTEVNGERDSSTTFGSSSIDSMRDSTTGRSVDNIRAFDSDVSIEIANNTYTMSGTDVDGKLKDTTTQSEHTDTEHSNEFTNTKTSAEHTDTHTNSGHTDEQTSDTHSTTVESVVSGNVGVTQTVAMLESEKAFWSMYSFLEILYTDIINEICEIVY